MSFTTTRIELPAYRQLQKMMNESGYDLIVGIFDERLAQLGLIHEFGAPSKNIPERSFFRSALKSNKKKYEKMLMDALKKRITGTNLEDKINEIGDEMVKDVKAMFGSSELAPLKDSTIKAKGSSEPLIDEGNLRDSIEKRVEKT